MRGEQPAREEADHGDERAELEVAEAADRVPRGAAVRVAGAEADQEAAHPDHDEPGEGEEPVPRDDLGGNEPAQIGQAERREVGDRRRRNRDEGVGRREDGRGEQTSEDHPRRHREVPPSRPPPVVTEVVEAGREGGGAQVPERRRDAPLLPPVPVDEGDRQPDEGAGDPPGPGTRQELEHGAYLLSANGGGAALECATPRQRVDAGANDRPSGARRYGTTADRAGSRGPPAPVARRAREPL